MIFDTLSVLMNTYLQLMSAQESGIFIYEFQHSAISEEAMAQKEAVTKRTETLFHNTIQYNRARDHKRGKQGMVTFITFTKNKKKCACD